MKKRITWCLLAALMVSAGCAAGPRIQGTSLGDKRAYTAYLGETPLFALVTDGSSDSYGTANTILVGATYEGQIKDPKSSKVMEFCSTSGGRNLRLGERHYELAEGRLFLVSVKTDPFRVEQLNVSEEELRRPTVSDEKITAFFQGN